MLQSSHNIADINRWWHLDDNELIWKVRWILLWDADIALRGRTFIWRILAHGLFTGEQASKIITGAGTCTHCQAHLETIPHIFFECPFARDIWRQTAIYYGASSTDNLIGNFNKLVEILDHCLGKTATNTARTLIFYETTFMIWKARNEQVFQNVERKLSVNHVA
jgi:hypothetical protein